MNFTKNILAVFALLGFMGCAGPQKRDVAQESVTECKETRITPLALGDELIFLESHTVTKSKNSQNNIFSTAGMGTSVTVEPEMKTGERIVIDSGTKLKIVRFNCFNGGTSYCDAVILKSESGRQYRMTCNGRDCVEVDLAKLFKKADECETFNIVPASAPAEAAPVRTPVEI